MGAVGTFDALADHLVNSADSQGNAIMARGD